MENSGMCLAQLLSKYNRLEKVLIGQRQSNKKRNNSVRCNTKIRGEAVFFTQTNNS